MSHLHDSCMSSDLQGLSLFISEQMYADLIACAKTHLETNITSSNIQVEEKILLHIMMRLDGIKRATLGQLQIDRY